MDKYYDPVTKIISVPEPEVELFADGLGCLMFQRMKEYPNIIAQIDADTGESETYSSFLIRCVRVALEMQKRGITRSDVISICSHNTLDSAVPYIAAFLLGVKVACLDPTLSVDDTKHLIGIVEPKLIFTSIEAEELISQGIQRSFTKSRIVVFGETLKQLEFKDFLLPKINENDFRPEPIDINETAAILFSSGSTGLQKGICWTHKCILHSTIEKYFTSAIAFTTLYWGSATYNTIASILHGGTKYFGKPFHPKRCWNYLAKYNIDFIFLSPSDSIQFYRNKPADIVPHLPCISITGSCLSEEHLNKMVTALPNTVIMYNYALTEHIGPFRSHIPMLKNKITSVGIPRAGRSYKIVDPETEEVLGFNQTGELRIKTKYCINGYYNQDSSSVWDSEGFIKSGDIGYYDEDFCFFIVDRIKEMFKYKSWHIIPAKIEAVISNHPDVEYCAVIGIPHSEEDNHIMAVVKLLECSRATADEIREFVESKMDDRHKLRAGLKLIDVMPLTPSGKIRKSVLRDMAIERRL